MDKARCCSLLPLDVQGLLDLVHQPTFVHDMYINTDCRIERANVFESICSLLSKTAFPVNSPLRAAHLLSLDGLFSILTTLAARCEGPRNQHPELHSYHDPEQFVQLWDALCRGQQPPISQAFKVGCSALNVDLCWFVFQVCGHDVVRRCVFHFLCTWLLTQLMGYQPATWADIVRCEKYLKGRLAVAADHFNRDPKKGFAFLQSINLLPTPLTATDVAKVCLAAAVCINSTMSQGVFFCVYIHCTVYVLECQHFVTWSSIIG